MGLSALHRHEPAAEEDDDRGTGERAGVGDRGGVIKGPLRVMRPHHARKPVFRRHGLCRRGPCRGTSSVAWGPGPRAHMHVYTHADLHRHACRLTQTHAHAHVHTGRLTHIHIHAHTCIHTHWPLLQRVCMQVTHDPRLLAAARRGLGEDVHGSRGPPFQMAELSRLQGHLPPFPQQPRSH